MPEQSGERPKTIWTPANVVTTIRAAFIPVWLIVVELAVPSGGAGLSTSSLGAAIFYMLLVATDKLDGYLARSRNEVTTFGKFLDPIADKLVVVTALLYLLGCGLVPVWMVFIIITREFIVSGVRMVVASEGVVIAASNLGKYKTAFTMAAISGYLIWLSLPTDGFAAFLIAISDIAMYVAVFLTAWSGIDYLVKSKDYLLKVD